MHRVNRCVAVLGRSTGAVLLYGMLANPAAAQPAPVTAVLDALSSVHPFGEVAISPNGKRVVYGNVVTGKRGGAEVEVSALWIAHASDGSGAARLRSEEHTSELQSHLNLVCRLLLEKKKKKKKTRTTR